MVESDTLNSELSQIEEADDWVVQSSSDAVFGVAGSDLIHGSSSQATNDPIWYVDRFRKHREQSVREVVNSAIAVCEGLDAIGDDRAEFQRFVKALADAKVMSRAEAKKQKRADMSTLSKIQKIYEHRDIILHQRVADKLCTGYSVLYELGLLIDQLTPEGDTTEDVRTDVSDKLALHLEELDGSLTRRWIKSVRESLGTVPTREKKADQEKHANVILPSKTPLRQHEELQERVNADGTVTGECADQTEDDRSEGSTTEAADETISDALDDGDEPIIAALIILEKENEEALVSAAQKSEWHRIGDNLAKEAVVFVYGPLQSLFNVVPAIGTFGCTRCTHVYSLAGRDGRELTNCNVFAIFERGEIISVERAPRWKPEASPFAIAEQFLQGLPGRRLQIFTDDVVEGWEALAFDIEDTPRQHRSPA